MHDIPKPELKKSGFTQPMCRTLPAGIEIAVLRGDLAKGGGEILLRTPPKYVVPNHSHNRSTNALRLTDARSLRSYPADRLHRVDDPHGLGPARPVHSDHAHHAARSGRSAWVGGVTALVTGMDSTVTSMHQLRCRLPRRKQIDLAIAGALVISATGCATRLFQRAVPLAVTGWTTSRHLMYQNPLDLVPPRKQDAEQLASQISI
jgi:hypothetical protein